MLPPTEEEVAAARQLGHHHEKNNNGCPPGYSGDDCSIQVDDCPSVRPDLVHSCYYGSSCIDASNEFGLLDRYCECDTAEELAAGLMCQYEATSVCIADGDDDEGRVTDQFCVNGGVCVAFVGSGHGHPGCICEAGKWEGKHCEFTHEILLEDALDLFQQRKAEIASERLIGGGTTLGDGEGHEKEGIPLIYVVGSFVAIAGVINLLMFAAWKSRKNRQQSKESEYHVLGIGSVSSKATKSTSQSTMPPPADVFVASRKKEVESYDGDSFMTSPGGHESETYGDQTDNVEVLDAETSRMIEAQFNSSGVKQDKGRLQLDSYDEDPVEELVFAPSYESDSESNDGDNSLLQPARITINSGKSPLSRLHNDNSPDDGINGIVEEGEAAVYKKGESAGVTGHANKPCSLDGEYDDDSDDDTYFV